MPVTLGLDLGPNSVGWALVDDDEGRIVDLGVRIFPEGVDNFDTKKEKPRNEDRRLARTMRRQTRRRARRKRRVKQTLIDQDLFPAEPAEQQKLYDADDSNPYALRARALDEKISLHELGRILLHLNQRRGFKSNRKSERKGGEVKDMLAEMSELEQAIKASGARTYGEFLNQKTQALDHTARELDDHLRGRHTQRDWLTEEFDLIWQAQQKHHPRVLTDELAYGKLGRLIAIHKPIAKSDPRRDGTSDLESFGLFGLIFFHRTLKPVPREIVGVCEYESKESAREYYREKYGPDATKWPRIDIRRCPRADRQAQKFRLLQEVNNLWMIDGSASPPDERPLNPQERALVIDKLMNTKEATFDQLRKWIAKLPESPAEEQIRFNLEEGKRKKLKGMVTDALLAAGGKSGAVGKSWYTLDEDTRDAVVRDLIDNLDDDVTRERLIDAHGLTPEQAEGALSIDLTEGPTKGYVNVSRLAIGKLLPYLEQGMRLMANDATDSAMHAAGYLRRDELQRRIFDELPDPARIHDAPIGDIPNPVVKRAIVELRKVVNAILREQRRRRDDPTWKPDAVHVEMAREVRQGPRQRSERTSRMREIEAERDKAKELLHQFNQPYGSRGSNILRVLLWEQQQHICPYSGRKIGLSQLFNDGQVDVDHILPYSRSLDDSQMNKVVCHRECNASKGNRTPYEWKADTDPEGYEQMLQYARHLPYPKRKRFMQKELKPDDFIARQLTATGYIAKATLEYLKCLFDDEHAVLGLKGQLTAELRRQWGLNDALRNDGIDLKTRDDHRHHAVDALVIALTDRSRLKALSKIEQRGGTLTTGEALDFPWDHFRDDAIAKLEMLDGGVDEHGQQRGVSHRVQRKVGRALHKEKPFGRVVGESGVWVKRKPLLDATGEPISASELQSIRDGGIQKAIFEHLESRHGIIVRSLQGKRGRPKIVYWDLAADQEASKGSQKAALSDVRMPSGVPIRKVRVASKSDAVVPIRSRKHDPLQGQVCPTYVEIDEQHHVCLFELAGLEKAYHAEYVSQLVATQRLLNQLPLIQRTIPSKSGARFLMSLCRGDMVAVEIDGKMRLMVVSTLVSTQKRIHLVHACDARRSSGASKKKDIGLTPTSFLKKYKGKKIVVDPIGRIRDADRQKCHIAGDPIPPEITTLAAKRVSSRISSRAAKQELKRLGYEDRGDALTAEIHRIRQEV